MKHLFKLTDRYVERDVIFLVVAFSLLALTETIADLFIILLTALQG